MATLTTVKFWNFSEGGIGGGHGDGTVKDKKKHFLDTFSSELDQKNDNNKRIGLIRLLSPPVPSFLFFLPQP